MRSIQQITLLTILSGIFIIPGTICHGTHKQGQKLVVFDIDQITFDGNLPAGASYIPGRNIIVGIKVHKDIVYVTIPRHGQTGIPATLATVKKDDNGKVLFSPFPDWPFQEMGKCTALQDVRSIEVDPKTDLLYIADNGNGGSCGPKLVVYDLAKKEVNASYELKLEGDKKSKINNLGDIAVDNQAVVYIANSNKFGSLWIVETKNGKVYFVENHGFRGQHFKPFVFENDTYWSNSSIKTITLTPDSKFLFYSTDDRNLWQVPMDMKKQLLNVRVGEIKDNRITGQKNFHGFCILMGTKFLFFSNVDNKSISYWDRNSDLENQKQGEAAVVKENEVMVNIQPRLEYFPGKMALDEEGYLWVVTMDLSMYFNETDNVDTRMKIVKIFVDNQPYNYEVLTTSCSARMFMSAIIVFICCLLASM